MMLYLAIIAGCTGFKSVTEGKHLFSGHVLDIDSSQFITNRSETKSELNSLFTQKPNVKFLWMRPYLSLYLCFKEPKKQSGFRYWMKYKLGEPPSFIEDINLPEIGTAIKNRLQNRGNFNAHASFKVTSKRKTARVKYFISPGKPYTLKTISFPQESPGIAGDINKLQVESILKQGHTYNLKDFELERTRIERNLREKGYFYFNADDLLFTADTTAGIRQINTWLDFKPGLKAESYTAFRLNDIYVFDDYSIQNYHPDTLKVGNYFYVSEKHKLHPQTILNSVFFEKDSLYSRTDHYNTLRRLLGIGVFKFASARFTADSSLPGKLNVNVLLTPVRKISLSAEVNASVKSDNFAGPGLNLSYKDRNIFGGAELFTVTLAGFFDVQYSGDAKGQASYELVLDASLAYPKFAFFNVRKDILKNLVPKTVFTTGGGIYTRVNQYQMYSMNVSVGYIWKPRDNITHTFNPMEVSFTNLIQSSADFEQFLIDNPTVAKSFEEQFIIGASYNFVNSHIQLRNKKHSLYLSETVNLAGNLPSLLATVINGSRPSPTEQYKVAGLAYSQFVKLTNDIRYYFIPNKKNQIAWRLIAGLALPYGNSSTIPYSRQYYAGGTNSIRAFVARSLGPGSYAPPDTTSNINVDQTGDIRLESNLEYRFGIYKYFKGALFVDAGNIWLVNDDPQRPGGNFDFNRFYKEIALGSGFGFRFDFNFILIRIDLAMPLYKPYLAEGERLVTNKIDLGSGSWRHQNIMWNVAIGYPF
jgi:outer membrane protein assembly factor BamA